MPKRLLLIAASLCIVAIAATMISAVPSGAENSRGPKLDKLHAERPTAAMSSVLASSAVRSSEVGKSARFHRASKSQHHLSALSRRRRVAQIIAAGAAVVWSQAVERYQIAAGAMAYAAEGAALQAEIDAAAAAAAAVHSAPAYVSYNSSPGGFLSCVRNRESGGNYGVYNSGGSGAAGAYQFLPGTWNSIAASSGRSDLVGVDPAQASPADQDAMAQALYAQQGAAPWGGGC